MYRSTGERNGLGRFRKWLSTLPQRLATSLLMPFPLEAIQTEGIEKEKKKELRTNKDGIRRRSYGKKQKGKYEIYQELINEERLKATFISFKRNLVESPKSKT